MKTPHNIVDITKHQDETDKATTKTSQSSLSSIISSIRLSNKRNAISSNLCNSVQNIRQRISNEVIKCDPHMYWHFDLKQRNDATDYWTNGCVWVGEFIAVAIGESDLVNLIDIRHRSVVSTFYCDSEPFSITAIADVEYLMICLPDSNKIDVLTIFDRCLTCVLEIDCEVPIFDIVHLYDCVFYGLASIKGDLYEIHLDGLKLSKVVTSESIKRALRNAKKLTFNKRSTILYVTCCNRNRNKVVGITANWEVKFVYVHRYLRDPYKAAVHMSGFVLLTSEGSNAVHVVTESLEHSKIFLRGHLCGPRAICFNDTQDKLAVVDSTPGKELRIYNLQTVATSLECGAV
ncbi:hypothetical protein DPMN_168857 [Dreissena polymorpha]|uniref:Uncharacterized protein n=1 Tax=Dreissena polymorpha TaxID=45954 RepID=A0A9D4F7C3_DREPO|nr:hypothetical protein DPMN_168857 [Dreissena polymorpha]